PAGRFPARSTPDSSSSRPVPPCGTSRLLLVLLDDRRRPDRGAVRVLAELAERHALPQQVPALIELDPNRLEAILLSRVEIAAPIERLLLVDERLDVIEDSLVRRLGHGLLRRRLGTRDVRCAFLDLQAAPARDLTRRRLHRD